MATVSELAKSGWDHYAKAMLDLDEAVALAEPQNEEAKATIGQIEDLIQAMAELRLKYRSYVSEVIGDS